MVQLDIEKIEKVDGNDREIVVAFPYKVTVDPHVPDFPERTADTPMTSKYWKIDSTRMSGKNSPTGRTWQTDLYESCESHTIVDYDRYAHISNPKGNMKRQQQKAFLMLVAQITEIHPTYTVSPHSGDVKRPPQNL